jgi:hypothetical protein
MIIYSSYITVVSDEIAGVKPYVTLFFSGSFDNFYAMMTLSAETGKRMSANGAEVLGKVSKQLSTVVNEWADRKQGNPYH